jgi:hypothetical protein
MVSVFRSAELNQISKKVPVIFLMALMAEVPATIYQFSSTPRAGCNLPMKPGYAWSIGNSETIIMQ